MGFISRSRPLGSKLQGEGDIGCTSIGCETVGAGGSGRTGDHLECDQLVGAQFDDLIVAIDASPSGPYKPCLYIEPTPVGVPGTLIELSVLARQAISGRMGTIQDVRKRIAVWQQRRNRRHAPIDWRFTADARIKLKRLYPSIED